MSKEKQVIAAFREILAHVESSSVQTDAILEFMLQRGEMNRLELDQVIDAARERQRAKWDKIRAKVASLLGEETGTETEKIA
jgi:hypothetical protein